MSCDKCKRLCNAHTNCMQGAGNRDSKIVIVGDAPELADDKSGFPFSSRYGKYFDNYIVQALGLKHSDFYYTNAIRCPIPKNKKALVQEMRNCRDHLFNELKDLKPTVIIAMGNAAIYSLLYLDKVDKDPDKDSGMSGITKWRGKAIWQKDLNCWIYPTYHPSYLMFKKNPGKKEKPTMYPTNQTLDDVFEAIELSKKPLPVMKYPETEWIQTKQRVLTIIDKIASRPYYAIDTETESLEWWTVPLYGISLCAEKYKGYYIDFQILDINDPEIHAALNRLFTNNAIKILHNVAYDNKILSVAGRDFKFTGEIFDTMIAAHLVDENFYKGLKPLTWINLNFGGYDKELDDYRRTHKILHSFRGLTGVQLSPYAAFDAVATFQLYELFVEQMKAENYFNFFTSVLMPARSIFTKIEQTGMMVDYNKACALDSELTTLTTHLEGKIYECIGYEINLNSSQQKQKLFFDVLKMTPLKETDASTAAKKIYSTDGASLEYLISQGGKGGDIAKLMQDYSYIAKQHSTFVKAVVRLSRKDIYGNYIMHTSYNTTGTVTLRVSCHSPCLHNVPNDGMVKAVYVRRPGNVILYADVKAAEMRVLAVLTQEPQLLKAFKEGKDVHTEVWRLMFDKPDDAIPTDDERQATKRVVFGLVYGMGVRALARRINKTVEEAKDYVYRFFDRLPNAREFFETTYNEVEKQGYITTVFNTRRRLSDIYHDDDYIVSRAKRQAVNTKVQSPAAIFTYIGLIRISKSIKKLKLKTKIIHSIHDCVMCDTPPDEVDIMSKIIKLAFETTVPELQIKMAVDVKKFENWGDDCKKSRIANIINKVNFPVSSECIHYFKEWLCQDIV